MPAPIVLFVFNRPELTMQTLESLENNFLSDESTLYVYADGPKVNSSSTALDAIAKVRSIVKGRQWCKEVILVESKINRGLAESVITGVTEVVNRHGKVIVLEDDLLISPYFLRYMNDGLSAYEDAPNVYAINGYMFDIKTDQVRTFLSPLATSTLGWGTWKDRWAAFGRETPCKDIIQNNRFIRARFNIADYDYASMLNNENSWGIRWYYSVFMRNGLGLFTTKSLIKHIGWGHDATHAKDEYEQMELFTDFMPVTNDNVIDWQIHEKLTDYFVKPMSKRSFAKRVIARVRGHLS